MIKTNFLILMSAESISEVNPARHDFDALWWYVSQIVFEVLTWNFDATLIWVLKLSHKNLGFISFIVWKLYGFQHFQQISSFFGSLFIITFDWIRNFNFWWFHRKDIIQIYYNRSIFNLKYLLLYLWNFFFMGKKDFFSTLLPLFFKW